MTNIGRSLIGALGLALTMSPAFARGGGRFHGGGGFHAGYGGWGGYHAAAGTAGAATAGAGAPGLAKATARTCIRIPITPTPLIEGKGTANG
jgi:hypothetical protein